MTPLYVVTEDVLSEAVVERTVKAANSNIEIVQRMGKQGSGYLKRKLPQMARLANQIPVLMVMDLDRGTCAPELLNEWTADVALPCNLLLRVAVREVEAWLLADRAAFSDFARVPLQKVPENPETLDDPKQHLLNIVDRYGNRVLKSALLPAPGSTSKVGILYNAELGRFVNESWHPERAAKCSDSLARTIRRLHDLRARPIPSFGR